MSRFGHATLALGGFGLVLIAVTTGGTGAIDRAVLAALREPARPGVADVPAWLVEAAIGLTMLGAGWVRALLAIGGAMLLAIAGRTRAALMLPCAWIVGAILVEIVKTLVARARPDIAYHLMVVHQPSFPSGHAAGAMLLYPLLGGLLGGRPATKAGVALAILIGLTRILLGVHWASDVVAGWLLGGAIALAAARIAGGKRRVR